MLEDERRVVDELERTTHDEDVDQGLVQDHAR